MHKFNMEDSPYLSDDNIMCLLSIYYNAKESLSLRKWTSLL